MLHGVLCAALAQTDRESGGGLAEARRLAGSRTFQDALLKQAPPPPAVSAVKSELPLRHASSSAMRRRMSPR